MVYSLPTLHNGQTSCYRRYLDVQINRNTNPFCDLIRPNLHPCEDQLILARNKATKLDMVRTRRKLLKTWAILYYICSWRTVVVRKSWYGQNSGLCINTHLSLKRTSYWFKEQNNTKNSAQGKLKKRQSRKEDQTNLNPNQGGSTRPIRWR